VAHISLVFREIWDSTATVRTTAQQGWDTLSNGDLLTVAEGSVLTF
jgi:hypothetical protein